MKVQVNSDNIINLGAENAAAVEARVRERLARFADKLTRIEVHLSDINGRENNVGDDKRCLIEARPASRGPVAVTSEAATLDAAIATGLARIITALEREFGRITTRKGH